MQIDRDNLWLCSDCTVVAGNGADGVELTDRNATLTGLAALGVHLVPNLDSEAGDGLREFSRVQCASCGTNLAGYRAQFATLK